MSDIGLFKSDFAQIFIALFLLSITICLQDFQSLIIEFSMPFPRNISLTKTLSVVYILFGLNKINVFMFFFVVL